MIGKWFSKSGKIENKASNPAKVESEPPVNTTPLQADAINDQRAIDWEAQTVIIRADPATLMISGTDAGAPLAANAFDAATLWMRPEGDFDQATFVVGAKAPPSRIASNLPLPAGTILNRRYEVIKPIGRGGFSFVYLCQHRRNGRLNAVKEAYGPHCARSGSQVIAGDGASLRQAKDALLREVSAISRINHPGVVRFEDTFEANGTLYFAMDFVEGEPLSTLLARRNGLSADTFAPLAASLLDAVETLHSNDVLHGDIKPSNIIVRPDKSAVLIDFGAAARLTDMNYEEPILTPGYSAPERYVRDGEVGSWSDVYSCAATLGAAMAGRPPPDLGIGADNHKADMSAFLRAAGERFPNGEDWIRGVICGLIHDIDDRSTTIADLRAAMGMAARTGDWPVQPSSDHSDGRSIFISYAHDDSVLVEALVRAIQRRGAGVWIDRQGIKPGSRAWGLEILNGMRGSQIVLLFSSARSMESLNVKDEVYLAKELHKPIIVARLDQAPFSDDILLFLNRTQHISVAEMEPPSFAAAIVDALNAQSAAAA